MEVLRRVRALRRRHEKRSLVEDTLDLHVTSPPPPTAPSIASAAAARHLLAAKGDGGVGGIGGIGGRSQSVSLLSCEDLNSLSSTELGLIFRDAIKFSITN